MKELSERDFAELHQINKNLVFLNKRIMWLLYFIAVITGLLLRQYLGL
jgi:hypothetical protein